MANIFYGAAVLKWEYAGCNPVSLEKDVSLYAWLSKSTHAQALQKGRHLRWSICLIKIDILLKK